MKIGRRLFYVPLTEHVRFFFFWPFFTQHLYFRGDNRTVGPNLRRLFPGPFPPPVIETQGSPWPKPQLMKTLPDIFVLRDDVFRYGIGIL